MLLLVLPCLIWTENASETDIFYNYTFLMMLFYSPIFPNSLTLMLVTEITEIELGHCICSGLFCTKPIFLLFSA